MKIFNWGCAFTGCLLGVSLLVTGCSADQTADVKLNKNTIETSDRREVQSPPAQNPSLEPPALLKQVNKVSVITQDGSEVSIDTESFVAEVQELFAALTQSDQSVSNFDYTVVLWTKQDQPLVMQVGENGVKLGDTYYRGKTIPLLNHIIKNFVGNNYFRDLQVDRIMISARDLGQTKQLNGEQVEYITNTLQKAQYIQDQPRLKDPLFPYYVLELDIGGKQIVEVDVISPTLMSVKLGKEGSYYQLQDSIFGPLKEEIPLIDFSQRNIKYLFKASQMKITDQSNQLPKSEMIIGENGTDPLEVKSITHYFARLLSSGSLEDMDFSGQSPSIVLQFMTDGRNVPVEVFADGFIFMENTYSRAGILEDIVGRIMENF